jgi:hypothetical protein
MSPARTRTTPQLKALSGAGLTMNFTKKHVQNDVAAVLNYPGGMIGASEVTDVVADVPVTVFDLIFRRG